MRDVMSIVARLEEAEKKVIGTRWSFYGGLITLSEFTEKMKALEAEVKSLRWVLEEIEDDW